MAETDGEFLTRIGTDGDKWADAFMHKTDDQKIDQDLMRGWFANAIEAGKSDVQSDFAKNISALDKVTKVASDPGNAHADPYMHGMANGLILARSIMNGTEPEFIEWPETPLQQLSDAIINASRGEPKQA